MQGNMMQKPKPEDGCVPDLSFMVIAVQRSFSGLNSDGAGIAVYCSQKLSLLPKEDAIQIHLAKLCNLWAAIH